MKNSSSFRSPICLALLLGLAAIAVAADSGALRVGAARVDVTSLGPALAAIDAELYTAIGQAVKKQSPLSDTVVVTMANGAANEGYIPTDDAFGHYTFQVLGSRLKPGCAETAIPNGLVELLNQSK